MQITNIRDINQPSPLTSFNTHIYMISAGATPKLITSDKLSNSAPKRLVPLRSLATLPSKPSKIPAIKIAITADSHSSRRANLTPNIPAQRAKTVIALGAKLRTGI